MTDATHPSPLGAGEATPWVITGTVAAAFASYTACWIGGTLAVALVGAGWHPAPYSLAAIFTLLVHGPKSLWPASPIAAGFGAGLGLAAALWLTFTVIGKINHHQGNPPGFARPPDVKPLREKAMAERARRLRPGLPPGPLHANEIGPPIGPMKRWHRVKLHGSWEDVRVTFMGPRSGKTTRVSVPAILAAPGACLVTSARADVLEATYEDRSSTTVSPALNRALHRDSTENARVYVFDPQQIASWHQDFYWPMLTCAKTVQGARRLATAFAAAAVSEADQRDFWHNAGCNLLTGFFHAAYLGGKDVTDVLRWLANPIDREPIDLLNQHNRSTLADQIQGTVRGAWETRDGIFETARQILSPLLDPEMAAWVTKPKDRLMPAFDPDEFALSRDTLFCLSKNGGGSAAGLIAALTDAVLQAAIAASERAGGRLDPPMVAELDEAANICPIPDLPDLMSHLGGRGVIIDVILQSYPQGQRAWGDKGMAAMWSAATLKLVGAGVDDVDFASNISKLIGEWPIWRHSSSFGGSSGHSTSVQAHDRPSMQAAQVRVIKQGEALLLATGIPIVHVTLEAWHESEAAPTLTAQQQRQHARMVHRARAVQQAWRRPPEDRRPGRRP